jgi:hypothetical protein
MGAEVPSPLIMRFEKFETKILKHYGAKSFYERLSGLIFSDHILN